MARWMLPIFILALLSLAGFSYVVLNLSPDQTSSVILFLVTFFLGLAFTLSLVFFFLHKKFFFKPKAFTAFGPVVSDDDLRPLFCTSLRNAFLASVAVIALAVLRVLGKIG